MKKTLIIILIVVIVIIMLFLNKYYEYKKEETAISEFNVEYEQYLDKDIYGTDIATIINMAVDNNETEDIAKDEEGIYIQNDTNSINIEVKINDLEEDTIYTMETLYNGGMATFVQYYNTIAFRCSEIKYNSAGKVCYMLFEQTSS